jgi:hypothetical protein
MALPAPSVQKRRVADKIAIEERMDVVTGARFLSKKHATDA